MLKRCGKFKVETRLKPFVLCLILCQLKPLARLRYGLKEC
ncbi:MAG: hypothetical protein AVDCRST_MAG74-93 [uncultured Pyrinomonadaceae bacterium]|uniref:Uncharacterized protein n=1 Tax=uncultured Pyrinomonadaceae bacterium TaxID=2283094 RepID=A0A6J4N4T5_9BACT|nr:MAG: hypothetical protein AVDCRST_MAG74-93 [uncultured Pyrinomonadaceae bacterium]